MTPERTQNRKNIKNPKHKSSYFKMPNFFAKMKRYGQNGDEFSGLELFRTPKSWDFSESPLYKF